MGVKKLSRSHSRPPPEEPPEFEDYGMQEASWIAIEPPLAAGASRDVHVRDASSAGAYSLYRYRCRLSTRFTVTGSCDPTLPPSFESAQYDIILRRQRQRPRGGGGVKLTAMPSRFFHLSNAFEFSGWGTMSRLKLTSDEVAYGEETVKAFVDGGNLGQFTASALAANAVLGGVFYTIPAVVAASGI